MFFAVIALIHFIFLALVLQVSNCSSVSRYATALLVFYAYALVVCRRGCEISCDSAIEPPMIFVANQ